MRFMYVITCLLNVDVFSTVNCGMFKIMFVCAKQF